MKRKFVYQSDTSNKFWNISIEEQTQIVNFGKLNTKGRETVKGFENKENCLHQSNKLIQQKLKKGYTEILTKEEIALSPKALQDDTGVASFWEIITKANRSKSSHWEDYKLMPLINRHILTAFSRILKQKILTLVH
jgi:predicted DNA-binding WGR domain protein